MKGATGTQDKQQDTCCTKVLVTSDKK